MNRKPIIGIVIKHAQKHEMDFWNRMDICDEFRYLICTNGGIAISLLSTEKMQWLKFLLVAYSHPGQQQNP